LLWRITSDLLYLMLQANELCRWHVNEGVRSSIRRTLMSLVEHPHDMIRLKLVGVVVGIRERAALLTKSHLHR